MVLLLVILLLPVAIDIYAFDDIYAFVEDIDIVS